LIVDRAARWLLLASSIFVAATWIFLLIRLFPLIANGRTIALHYNIHTNVNAVGAAWWALATPAIGTAILVLNVLLSVHAYMKSRQNAIVIMTVTVFYELLILAAGFFVLLINTPR